MHLARKFARRFYSTSPVGTHSDFFEYCQVYFWGKGLAWTLLMNWQGRSFGKERWNPGNAHYGIAPFKVGIFIYFKHSPKTPLTHSHTHRARQGREDARNMKFQLFFKQVQKSRPKPDQKCVAFAIDNTKVDHFFSSTSKICVSKPHCWAACVHPSYSFDKNHQNL